MEERPDSGIPTLDERADGGIRGLDEGPDPRPSAMEASGMGLLPGMAVALAIGMAVIALVLLDSWWVVPVVALGIGAVTVAVVIVVLAVLEDDPNGRLHRNIPGL